MSKRRDVDLGPRIAPAAFVAAAVVVWFIEGPSWPQVVLPTAVAVAVGVTVSLIASRTRRFRGALFITGWLVAAFGAAALVADPSVEPVAAALLYPPAMLWSALFFDIPPETFRGDAESRP